MTKVYLAGAISGLTQEQATDWRNRATERLNAHGIETLDPMRGWKVEDQTLEHAIAIFERDYADIEASDIVLVYMPEGKGVGTWIEFGIAYQLGIELVVVTTEKYANHPFVYSMADFTFNDLDDALSYIVECFSDEV